MIGFKQIEFFHTGMVICLPRGGTTYEGLLMDMMNSYIPLFCKETR